MQRRISKPQKPKKKAATWWDYERHKRIIAAKRLTSREYEKAILDLTHKLGI